MDVENVAYRLLQRAVNGTPAKRLLGALVKTAMSENLGTATPILTLLTARPKLTQSSWSPRRTGDRKGRSGGDKDVSLRKDDGARATIRRPIPIRKIRSRMRTRTMACGPRRVQTLSSGSLLMTTPTRMAVSATWPVAVIPPFMWPRSRRWAGQHENNDAEDCACIPCHRVCTVDLHDCDLAIETIYSALGSRRTVSLKASPPNLRSACRLGFDSRR